MLQLLGLVLLVYAMASWVGALRGGSDPLRPLQMHSPATAQTAEKNTEAWTTLEQPSAVAAALQDAKAAGMPALLDVYADWCISCKVIEREVLPSEIVSRQLGNFRLIRFDMTASNSEQRALLDSYQLFGPPAILLFSATGQEQLDLRSIGETTAEELAKRLETALSRERQGQP
jgi:thiol:disulfide interchange protein DsbD